ncbi:MFS transporter [Ornithinibacillus xuwenensis]|uniref:MFS transporter n=1 Tax=Ornithinibacillus xuwenensis TaxID=3144668 RepID=A0ABU9XCJ3_9BACI
MRKTLQYVIGKTEINRDLILLLVIGGLYSLGIYLSNTFVNIYLWKQADGNYYTIAIYNLAVFVFQPITFIFAGKIAKKVDRVIVLRLGVIFLSLFFLTVLLIGENAATYNFILGSLLGIGYGFYWLAFNVLTFEITEPDTRDFFNGFLGVLQSFGGMIGPFSAGFIISKLPENIGYSTIFTVSFILFICAVGSSFFLKRRPAEGVYYFKRVVQERKNNKNWNRILNAHIFQGLREGIFLFVITIWVYIVTKSELSLGTFNLYFSGFSFVFYFLATRLIKPSKRKKAILIGSLMLYLSLFIILSHASYTTLIIYGIIIGMAYPIINVPYISMTYDVIGRAWKAGELRIEYIVVREVYLNIGRVTSIIVFIMGITYFNPDQIIPVLLVIFGAMHLFIYFFVRNIFLTTSNKKEVMVKDQVTDENNR